MGAARPRGARPARGVLGELGAPPRRGDLGDYAQPRAARLMRARPRQPADVPHGRLLRRAAELGLLLPRRTPPALRGLRDARGGAERDQRPPRRSVTLLRAGGACTAPPASRARARIV